MALIAKASRILEQPVCDDCLGRQFGRLLHGYTNNKRGQLIRTLVAMSIDKEEKYAGKIDISNFSKIIFHKLHINREKAKKCSVCNGFFLTLDTWVKKISKAAKFEFSTFLIGTKLSGKLLMNEENLWERVGIEYCEPIKAEINREVGKRVEKAMKVKTDLKNPNVNIILDIQNKKVRIEVNPIFIYSEYQKLKRGIPQTKWPSKKYKTSVEEIAAKPFMSATHGKGHKLHGEGREDIDARCLAWRPFVLEIAEPKKRHIKLKKLSKRVGKQVKIRNTRFSNINEVRRIKESRSSKTYSMHVVCGKSIKKADLKKLSSLAGKIDQKTPERVLHRRADRRRRRKLISIKTKWINSRKFLFIAKCEAGLYVKELVSGDSGRTKPNVSDLLGTKCSVKDLDVIKIQR